MKARDSSHCGSVVGKGEKSHLNNQEGHWQDCMKLRVGKLLLKVGDEMDTQENVPTTFMSGSIWDVGIVEEEYPLRRRHGHKRHTPFPARR